MTKDRESKDDMAAMFADEWAAAWMEEHLEGLKQSVAGPHYLYASLVSGFVVGLAAHVGGYVLISLAPRGFLGLLAELLYALGLALWTGVVVALFVQVIPEAKRRQIKRALEVYEAVRREKLSGG